MRYLKSFFSIKKLLYKRVSFFSIWDSTTSFPKEVNILRFAKLSSVKMGRYSRIGVNSSLSNVVMGNFTAIGRNCAIGLGQHPLNYVTTNSIFYKKNNWKFHDEWVKGLVGFNENKQIRIGNDVWIGLRVIILDGVTIGDGRTTL